MGAYLRPSSGTGEGSDLMAERRRFMGVDPGKAGAIVLLEESGDVLFGVDLPQEDDALSLLWDEIFSSAARVYVVVEKVWSNPVWGKRHCFEFGRQKGRIEQAITSAGFTYYRIQPTTWQRYFEMAKTPAERNGGSKGQREWKKRLQRKAIQIFDGRVTLSRADAYLLAEYCRLNILGGTL